MAARWAEALRRHAAQLEDLQGAHAEEFLRLLRGLQDAMRGRLSSIAPTEASLDAFRVMTVIRETEAAISALETKAKGQYSVAQKEAAELAIDHAGAELDLMQAAFAPAADPLAITLDPLIAMADPAQGLLASHFATSVQRYGGELLNGVRQQLFTGLRAGDSMGDMVGRIAGQQGPMGVVGRSNAERLVRTEVSQSYGAAQHNSIAQAHKQVPGLKKMWLHVGSYLCPTCGPLHGTERPLDGTWTIRSGKKTREVAHAPAHPRCTCRVTAVKQSWRDKMKKLGYLSEQDDSGEPGKAAL